jgi:uncharacterized protein
LSTWSDDPSDHVTIVVLLYAIHESLKFYPMSQNFSLLKSKYTLGRVLLFCLCCAIVLAVTSGLTKGMPKQWSQHLLILIAAIVTFGLTVLFVRWEGLKLKDVGAIPGKNTVTRFFGGFFLGSILAIFQAVLLLSFAPVKLLL